MPSKADFHVPVVSNLQKLAGCQKNRRLVGDVEMAPEAPHICLDASRNG